MLSKMSDNLASGSVDEDASEYGADMDYRSLEEEIEEEEEEEKE